MKGAKQASGIAVFLLLVMVIILLIGQFLGQPLLLGFVETGSMAPTLEAGDGFVAMPPSLAGEVQEGDVVTFDAQELQGGGLTTHRVVEVTDEGYVTQGDANPFTDQDGDEPIVSDAQIVAVAYHSGEDPVRIPYLGLLFMGIQSIFASIGDGFAGIPILSTLAGFGIGNVFVAMGIILLVYAFMADVSSGKKSRTRSRSRARGYLKAWVILVVILAFILVPVNASIFMQSGPIGMDVISATSPSDNPNVIQRGTSEVRTFAMPNDGFIPLVSFIEPGSQGVSVDQSTFPLSPGEEGEANITVTAPDETGYYVRYIEQWTYPMVLPPALLATLHGVHPIVAVLAINVTIAGLVIIVFALSVGFKPVRMDSRGRDVPLSLQIRRWLNRKL